MIQELLGGVVDERKITIPSFPLTPSSSTSSLCSSPSQSAASLPSNSATSAADAGGQHLNLRCPRCDSSNTKFCYYNNYNLTQPRHFCKTCRRYWTKGGALRNVPIGGGCRKTKAAAAPSLVVPSKAGGGGGKGTHHKPMTSSMMSLDVMGRAGGGGPDLSGPELLPSGQVLWAGSMPHSTHLLSLLRASQQMQNPNPNPLLDSIRIKDDGGALPILDHHHHHLGQLVIGTTRNNENPQFQYHQQLPPPQKQNLLLSEAPTISYCNSEHPRFVGNNVGHAATCSPSSAATTMTTTAATASIPEPTPMTGNDFCYWNPATMWTELSTAINGAFPHN